MRGGLIDPADASVDGDDTGIYYAGKNGYYWSSRADSSTTSAYSLYFNDSSVNPFNGYYYRYRGYSLRCLIPTP